MLPRMATNKRRRSWLTAFALYLMQSLSPWTASGQAELEGVAFFEQHIRPLFIESCHDCHSAKAGKRRGGLALDTAGGLMMGGSSGPAIVPGEPSQSRLWLVVSHQDSELKMPRDQAQLPQAQQDRLAEWIRMGAPMPADPASEDPPTDTHMEAHWAFQPITPPPSPQIKDNAWVLRGMDRHILSKLEAAGIQPNPPSDRRNWLRRVSYNLTGLPPTQEEVQRLLSDKHPMALEMAVDRLLASPAYGERWARHWMDVSRYADTKGYVFQSDRSYPYAYTYRDFLIRAFNQDLPYDLFLKQQLAADLMDLGEDKRPLAALGYLTLGRRFLNNQHDIIDDRIDVVFRGMMGLTVSCARCHTHKYDPIPIEDYYSLYGVFASSQEPDTMPLLGGDPPAAYPAYLEELKRREQAHGDYLAEAQAAVRAQLIEDTPGYLMAAHESASIPDPSQREALARERKLDPPTVQRWAAAMTQWEGKKHPIMFPWMRATESATFPPINTLLGEGKESLNSLIQEAIQHSVPKDLPSLANLYGEVFTKALEIDTQGGNNALQKANQGDQAVAALVSFLKAPDAPPNLPDGDLPRLFEVKVGEKVRRLKREWEALDAEHPGAPPRAMALMDRPSPVEPVVFGRGQPGNRGARVPRQFLGFLEGPERKPFTHGSGRLELAEKITSLNNPLTARVWVNRVWSWHFGRGLVDSASDFGLRCDRPVQEDLINYLASFLVEHQWSIKALQREILLSATFAQSSQHREEAAAKDPENRLWWQFQRQRLDLEAMRDTLLSVTGQLDHTMNGRPVDITRAPWTGRRSVYGYIERQNLPNFFRTFDLASPDASSPGRFKTTVPQQALYLMNSPFMEAVVDGHQLSLPQDLDESAIEQSIVSIYGRFFQRPPSQEELTWGKAFFRDRQTGFSLAENHRDYVHALLMSNELIFLD